MLAFLSVVLPLLIAVAFVTVAERKRLRALQRRVRPNAVRFYGILQPFADALKLIAKETLFPVNSWRGLLVLAPVLILVCSLLGVLVVPFGSGVVYYDASLRVLLSLALSGLAVYRVIYGGWAVASSYAFIGALRSAAQMVSYELALSTAVAAVVAFGSSLSLLQVIEVQEAMWIAVPLVPLMVIWCISALAECNRTPFDLPEAESELVAGYMTEHSAVPFVLYFLAEYGALLLMSLLGSVIWFGGYYLRWAWSIDGATVILSGKALVGLFRFIWARRTLPRLRYDQLMSFGWCRLLPLAGALMASVVLLLSC